MVVVEAVREQYFWLLKQTLSGMINDDPGFAPGTTARAFDPSRRAEGNDWPTHAVTMIGLKRLDNLQYCVEQVLKSSVLGDLIETGVWRGGAAIFMKAVLRAYGDTTRNVWVADSFAGLPPSDVVNYPHDAAIDLSGYSVLAVSRAQVESNFRRYRQLDDRVRFLEGWFKDTLPSAPIERLSVLRLDGDLYESTIQALDALYPKLSVGGFVIVDDYGAVPGCRTAIEDYRARHSITTPLVGIDWSGVFWQKT